MRTPFALTLALCAAAFGQNNEATRTFPFAHVRDPQQIQEVVNTIRSIAEAQHVTADHDTKALTVRSTPECLAFVAWLFTDLDRPAGLAPPSLQARENDVPDKRAPLAKIFHLAHIRQPQQIQELVNGIRSIAELQRVVPVTATASVIVRGSRDQVSLAEWIAREIDQATGGGARKDGQNTFKDDDLMPPQFRSPAVRLYYPVTMTEPLQIQETVNALRVVADIQRAVTFAGPRAILIRGKEEQAKVVDWLLREFDQQTPKDGPAEYLWPGRADGIVRVAYLRKETDLPATWKRVRESTGLQRVTAFTGRHALVMRGTAAEVAAFDAALR